MTIEHSLGSASTMTPEETASVLGNLGTVLKVIAVGIVMLLLVLASTIVRMSMATLSSGRFPPPGVQVLRATKVMNGTSARRKALLGFVLAGLVVAAALVAAATLWNIASSLIGI